MIQPFDMHTRKLPYPTRTMRLQGQIVEEYIIPDDQKQLVLEQLYLYEDIPSLDDEMFDLHEGKTFLVGQYRVFWERGQNWLVSPYYPNSGGSVIDWIPADQWNEDEDDDWDEDWDDDDASLGDWPTDPPPDRPGRGDIPF